MALRGGDKFYMGGVFGHEGVGTDVKEGGNQIEYEDQEPEIHKLFAEECAKNGVRPPVEGFWKRRDG